ncbi:MAG: hypothetical protein KTR25_16615 [Myxococcales bacterium]|nr:hypothetical protein [Myxococcales bacterium]
MDAWLPHTPVEIALKQQVKHIMDYARKLKAAAKHCRQENDHDCALAFEAKYLFLAQRWTKNFTELPKKLTSEIRVAYLELGRQLLEQGDGTGARRAQELAYQIEPNHADTNELGSKLDEFARAAFLRGYGLYRDQGPGALKSARELWKFAYGSASAGSLIQQKAQQMLSQTAQ